MNGRLEHVWSNAVAAALPSAAHNYPTSIFEVKIPRKAGQ
jgi:hypothetical protein